MLNVSIKSVIVSTEYGKEGNMPQSDILNSNLKMCSILHHSIMYPFGSGIFQFQGRRSCWGNCVFPCVFGNVLSLGYGLQLWICGSQDCASNSEPVVLPGSSDWWVLLNPTSFLAPNGLVHLFAGSCFLQSFLPSWQKRVFTCISDIVVESMIVCQLKLLVCLCWCAKFWS